MCVCVCVRVCVRVCVSSTTTYSTCKPEFQLLHLAYEIEKRIAFRLFFNEIPDIEHKMTRFYDVKLIKTNKRDKKI